MSSQPAETNRKTVLYLLLGVTIVAQIDRNAMSMLVQPIADEFALSDGEIGFLLGPAFVIFFALFGIPFGMWADRGNRRNIITFAMTLWSLLTMACGAAVGFVTMALARMGVAVGEAGANPPAYSMISDLYEERERGTALGVYSMGPNLGILIGFAAAGYFADLIGWRWTFIVLGAPGILLAVALYFGIEEPKRTVVKVPDDAPKAPPLLATLRLLASQRTVPHLLAGGALAAFVGIGFSNWLPPYFERNFADVSATVVGISLGVLIGVVGGAGTFLGGYISDKVSTSDIRWRLWVCCIAIVLGWPIGVAALFAGSYWMVLILISLPTFVALFHLASVFMLVQQLVDIRMRATAIAVLLMTNNLIGGLGPQYIGSVSDLLTERYGDLGLKIAMASVILFAFWAAVHFYLASRHIRADLARLEADEAVMT